MSTSLVCSGCHQRIVTRLNHLLAQLRHRRTASFVSLAGSHNLPREARDPALPRKDRKPLQNPLKWTLGGPRRTLDNGRDHGLEDLFASKIQPESGVDILQPRNEETSVARGRAEDGVEAQTLREPGELLIKDGDTTSTSRAQPAGHAPGKRFKLQPMLENTPAPVNHSNALLQLDRRLDFENVKEAGAVWATFLALYPSPASPRLKQPSLADQQYLLRSDVFSKLLCNITRIWCRCTLEGLKSEVGDLPAPSAILTEYSRLGLLSQLHVGDAIQTLVESLAAGTITLDKVTLSIETGVNELMRIWKDHLAGPWRTDSSASVGADNPKIMSSPPSVKGVDEQRRALLHIKQLKNRLQKSPFRVWFRSPPQFAQAVLGTIGLSEAVERFTPSNGQSSAVVEFEAFVKPMLVGAEASHSLRDLTKTIAATIEGYPGMQTPPVATFENYVRAGIARYHGFAESDPITAGKSIISKARILSASSKKIFDGQIHAATVDGNIAKLRGLWQEAQELYPALDAPSNGYSDSAAQSKLPDQTGSLFLNTKTLRLFVVGFCGVGDPKSAIEVWNYCIQNAVPLNIALWTAMFPAVSADNNGEALKNFWDEMIHSGIEPDWQAAALYANLMIHNGRGDQAVKELHRIMSRHRRKPGLDAHSADGIAAAQTLPAASPPDARTLDSALGALISAKGRIGRRFKMQLMQDLLAWADQYGIKPTTTTFNALMTIRIQERQVPQMLRLFETMQSQSVVPDAYTWSILVHGFVQPTFSAQQQQESISRVFDMMQSRGFSPTIQAYGAIVEALLKQHKDVQGARAIFDHLRAKQMPISEQLYTMLAQHYLSDAEPDAKALEALCNSISSGKFAGSGLQDSIIERCADIGLLSQAMSVLQNMGKARRRPRWKTLTKVFKALVKADQWSRARELVLNAQLLRQDYGRERSQDMLDARDEQGFWDHVEYLELTKASQPQQIQSDVHLSSIEAGKANDLAQEV